MRKGSPRLGTPLNFGQIRFEHDLFRPAFARRSVERGLKRLARLRAGGKPVLTPDRVRGQAFSGSCFAWIADGSSSIFQKIPSGNDSMLQCTLLDFAVQGRRVRPAKRFSFASFSFASFRLQVFVCKPAEATSCPKYFASLAVLCS
jgi:hypothetical protein